MTTRVRLFVLITLFWVPSPAGAQRYSLDATRLQLGVDSMDMAFVRLDSAVPLRQFWEELRIVETVGGRVLHRITRILSVPLASDADSLYRLVYEALGPPSLDTTVVRLPGFQPAWRHTYEGTHGDTTLARGNTGTGWHRVRSVSDTTIRPLPDSVIDVSLFTVALRAAPLKRLYQLTLLGYSASSDSLEVLNALVVGSEGVTQRDGTIVDAWRLNWKRGDLQIRLWIDKQTRALTQQMVFFGPYAGYVRMKR